jgi:hypothetical protein
MIRLLVQDTCWPPPRLRILWVNTLRDTGDNPASIVREMNLLPRLNKFDVRLCDSTTVELLEILKCLFIVPS